MRTGRACPHLLDRVIVDYYGAADAAQAARDDRRHRGAPAHRHARTTSRSIKAIEKAIMESDLGLTPNNDGNVIRLQIPELTEERRKELVKVVHGIAEEGRVAIRNVRRDVMHDLRELKKEGEVGADDEHRAEAELQKLTDAHDRRDRRAPEGQGRGDPRGLMRRPAARRRRRATSRSSPTATAAGRSSAACRCIEGHRRAPTSSRRGCATPPSSASRS